MTPEQNPESVPAAPEPLPFTEAAAARLALSREMIFIAKNALSLTDPTGDAHRTPGELFAAAVNFEAAAEFAIGAAVAAERAAGTSWDQIGEHCDPATDKRGAQRKYGHAWKAWQTELARDPWLYRTENLSDRTADQAAAVAAYLTSVGRLDPEQDGAAAITAALSRHTLLSLLGSLHRDEEKLRAAYAYPDPSAIARLAEARAKVYDRLAATAADNNQPDQRRTNEGLAAQERERAAAYRARPAEAVPYSSTRLALDPAPVMYAEANENGRCRWCDGTGARCQVCHQPRHDADADHEPSLLPCRGCNGGAYPVRPAADAEGNTDAGPTP